MTEPKYLGYSFIELDLSVHLPKSETTMNDI